MSRPMLAAMLTLAALGICPTEATAKDLWAVLEEFSGPGPFKGGSFGATFCFGAGGLSPSPFSFDNSRDEDKSNDKGGEKPWCVHGDRGKFAAEPSDDGVFPRIEITLTEFGAGMRVHDGLDVGLSAGWMAFVTDDTRYRPVITPVRIVTRPILLLPIQEKQRWHGILSVYFKTPFVFGDITGTHFGAEEADAFHSDGEFVPSYGITFDLGALLPGA